MPHQSPLALYLHWPFCLSKCPYCDFNSREAATPPDQSLWRESYARELAHYAPQTQGRPITSIFFGGGTPSLMDPQTVEHILQTIAKHWSLASDCEITLEANPTSSESRKFAAFRAAGINRLSLGVQSLRDDALKFLGRTHDANAARAALDLAATHFPRFTFDLIYARADQTLKEWETELREALTFNARHMSLYQLTIEPNTAFAKETKPLQAPDDLAATMYELTQDIMTAANLPAYEISNHAASSPLPLREGLGEGCNNSGEAFNISSEASRHNLTYWHYDDYLGIGPGAHGRIHLNTVRTATENHRAPNLWLRDVKEHGHGQSLVTPLDDTTAQREALMMGLRLTTGIDKTAWQKKFTTPPESVLPTPRLTRLIQENLLISTPQTLRATPTGLQRLNALLTYLLT